MIQRAMTDLTQGLTGHLIPFILIEHLLYTGESTLLPEAPGVKATPQALPTEESANLQTGVTNSPDSAYEEISFLETP